MVQSAPIATEHLGLLAEVPSRASGVDLFGELDHSGYKEPPCIARRGDGQAVQLTRLLYQVLEAIDGHRDMERIAAAVTQQSGRLVSGEDIHFLVREKLQPLGLLRKADGSEPVLRKRTPLLALRPKVVLTNERVTRWLTAPFTWWYRPRVVAVVLALYAAVMVRLLSRPTLSQNGAALFSRPSYILAVLGLTVVSAAFHELGHAAACRYSGGRPGAMGAGLYLVWPAFYTDVTDSYRLDRRGRLRTDLGGLYFNMVFSVAAFAAWLHTGWQPLPVFVLLQALQMLTQLLPVVRLDGYLILADLTGVPDLFARIRPTLASLIPWRPLDHRVAALRRWVRVVVTAWVFVVVPMLAFGLWLTVTRLPQMLTIAWASSRRRWHILLAANDWSTAILGLLSIAAIALPVLSSIYVLCRVTRRAARHRWGRVLTAGAIAALLWVVVAGENDVVGRPTPSHAAPPAGVTRELRIIDDYHGGHS